MEVEIKSSKKKKRSDRVSRVRWWTYTKENETKLSAKISTERIWKRVEDADRIQEAMTECIRRSTTEILGTCRGAGSIL